ncbi:MAG TPA: arginine deiminase family protein [Myxococcota bacterium]
MRSTHLYVGRVACDDDLASHAVGVDDKLHGHVHNAACRYRVVSRINPHMKVGAVDFARARAQHRDFVAALRFCGASVEQLPFVHGCPDSVFVKDMGLLTDGVVGPRALLGSMRHEERAPEQEPRRRHLQRHHFTVQKSSAVFEGGDVVVGPRAVFFGIGERSTPEAAVAIATFLGRRVQVLELIDEQFFHLDTCLAVLDDGTALVAEGALSPSSLRAIEQHPGIARVVMVDREAALLFGLNVVQIGDAVVVHAAAKAAHKTLQQLGKMPVVVELSEFLYAGGGAACLVSKVHEQRVLAEQSVAA